MLAKTLVPQAAYASMGLDKPYVHCASAVFQEQERSSGSGQVGDAGQGSEGRADPPGSAKEVCTHKTSTLNPCSEFVQKKL